MAKKPVVVPSDLDQQGLDIQYQYSSSDAVDTSYGIESGADDAIESISGELRTTDTVLPAFYDVEATGAALGEVAVGFRFTDVTLPDDAVVVEATIELNTIAALSQGEGIDATITVDTRVNAPEFADRTEQRVLNRPMSDNEVAWFNMQQPNDGDTFKTLSSPSIISLVRRVTSSSEWTGKGDLAFVFELRGSDTDESVRRAFSSFESGDTTAQLQLSYVIPEDDDALVALRFDDLNIPRGATINTATLKLVADGDNIEPTTITIYGEGVDDSEAFTDDRRNLSDRYSDKTSASVEWVTEDWTRYDDEFSPDIGDILYEITSRDDWCGGNALTLLLSGRGDRAIQSYDNYYWNAPVLQVNYDPSSITDFSNTCLRTESLQAVISGSDDAMENARTGTLDLSSEILRTHVGDDEQIIGLRFSTINVPQGASVSSAYLQLPSAGYSEGDLDISIKVEDESYSEVFDSSNEEELSSRSFVSESIRWPDVPELEDNNTLTTIDFASAIQPIIDRSNWVNGNAMTVTLTPSSGASGERYFYSAASPENTAAKLIIHYQQDGSDYTSSAQVLKSGRQEIIRVMHDLDSFGGTPLVDAYFEATQYMRGEEVFFGLQRGTQETTDRFQRVSVPESYSGTTSVYRPPGCEEVNLSAVACITEEIRGDAVYNKPEYGECKANQIVLLSDGIATHNNSVDAIKQTTGTTHCSTRDEENEECGIELARWLYAEDENSSINGVQSVITNTVGFNISSSFLEEVATAGGGSFFEAESTGDLKNAFNAVINNDISGETGYVAPATSVSLSNRLVNSNDVFYAMFQPDITTDWDGNLKRYVLGVDSDGDGSLAVFDSLGQKALTDEGVLSDDARSFWSTSDDGKDVAAGGAASRLELDRNVYTSFYDSPGDDTDFIDLDTEAVDLVALGIEDTSTAYRDELVRWAEGVDIKDFDGDGDVAEVRAQMGDPMHSEPTVLSYEGTGDTATSIIFMGTNHGFLHAIDVSDGTEQFAWIPDDLLTNLDHYYRNETVDASDRPYGLDGEVTSWHNDLNGNNIIDEDEKAYIYVGMRRGGRNYYALDVSKYNDPKIAWKIEGGQPDGDFAELGQTWSQMVKSTVSYLGTVRDVLFFAGGYDERNDAQSYRSSDFMGRGIYMVDAATGELISSRDRNSSGFGDMRYSFPSDLRVIDPDNDGDADMIFVGDTGGQLWRFDINNDAETDTDFLTGTVLANFSDVETVDNRQFFYEPDIALANSSDGNSFLNIAIGSGERYQPNDLTVQNRYYSIRSYNIFGPPLDAEGNISYPDTLTEDDLVDVSTSLGSADTSGDIVNGWFFNFLGDGEKSLSTTLTLDDTLYFTTYVPPATAAGVCSASIGTGQVYSVDLFYGDPANGETEETSRFVVLTQLGIPPRVSGLIVEAAPNIVSKFVGLETVNPAEELSPFQRIFWAEE